MFQEGFLVELDGVADVDQVVVGFLEAFLCHEFFFIELFARAKSGVLNLNIDIRFEAGEADQVPGQVIDLDRGTHIQHEDLAAFGVGAGQHDQGDSFRDCHEVADDVRVGHGDGAAFFNLLFEDRNDGAVGAQDVAEADGYEFGFDIFRFGACLVVDMLTVLMGEDLGNLICFSFLDFLVEGLDDHLTQALAGAHDVGRVDGLVRGDQDKALAAMDHGCVGGLVSADGVVLDRFAGTVLHEGDMLMRCGVIYDFGPVGFEDFKDPAAVPDGADEGFQVEVGVFLFQLQLDAVGIVLVNIEDDQLFWFVCGNLPAEFRTDASAAAGDQNGLPGDELEDFLHVSLDRIPAEEIFNGDLLHGTDGNISGHKLI